MRHDEGQPAARNLRKPVQRARRKFFEAFAALGLGCPIAGLPRQALLRSPVALAQFCNCDDREVQQPADTLRSRERALERARIECIHALIDGVGRDLEPVAYPDWEALRSYCWDVAGVIGLVSLRVFGGSGADAERDDVLCDYLSANTAVVSLNEQAQPVPLRVQERDALPPIREAIGRFRDHSDTPGMPLAYSVKLTPHQNETTVHVEVEMTDDGDAARRDLPRRQAEALAAQLRAAAKPA